jgi:multicomponent K+:H+ antiporter subunit C
MTAWLVATGIGVLVGTGTWLALRARTFDVVLGLTLLTYGVNLFIFAMGRVVVDAEPILRPGVPATLAHYTDPLPQALVLTAIVISFAMTAVLLALALKGRFDLDDDRCDAGVDEPDDQDDHGPDPEHAHDRGHAKARPPAHVEGREGEPR